MDVPDGVEVRVEGHSIAVKGPKGELSKAFNPLYCKVRVDGGKLLVEPNGRSTRRFMAAVGSVEAHARNMFKGVRGDYEKKLTMVYAHFPISIEVKGKEVLIKNFLGEKLPRKSGVVGATKVSVQGSEITVRGPDKEAVGQTASNLTRAAKPHKKDIRVFQDGIYLLRE